MSCKHCTDNRPIEPVQPKGENDDLGHYILSGRDLKIVILKDDVTMVERLDFNFCPFCAAALTEEKAGAAYDK